VQLVKKSGKGRSVAKAAVRGSRAVVGAAGGAKVAGRLKRKDYDKELAKLHVELVKLQRWVQGSGAKVCVVFEGRDGAGKGGTIKAITERVSPRCFG
jgi:polyphosphate kinase